MPQIVYYPAEGKTTVEYTISVDGASLRGLVVTASKNKNGKAQRGPFTVKAREVPND